MEGFISGRKDLYLVLCLIIHLSMKRIDFVITNEMVNNGCLYDNIRLMKIGILMSNKPGVDLGLEDFVLGLFEIENEMSCAGRLKMRRTLMCATHQERSRRLVRRMYHGAAHHCVANWF